MKYNKNKGITLISLVITIVVLVLIAGVSISFVIGNNGLFKKASNASDTYKNASNEEQLKNKIVSLEMSKDGNAKFTDLNEWSNPDSENYEPDINLWNDVSETDEDVIIEYNGLKFKINSNFEISNVDQNIVKPLKIGDTTNLEEGWNASSVNAIFIGNDVIIPIPKNFYYVGGSLDTGVIISDNINDSYKHNNRDMSSYADSLNLQGNQFVWIPCLRENYNKVAWGHQNQTGWSSTTNSKEFNQIDKYKGFYVARYEAGLPNNIQPITSATVYNSDVYNRTGIPESKSNKIPWSFIDWNTCKTNTQNMYNYDYVKADLITGTQWDVILNKLQEKAGVDPNNGTTWGNTSDDTLSFNGDYSTYSNGKQYPFGDTSVTGVKLYKTGMSESAMKYGIADLAGNIWERVNEAPSDTDINSSNKLLRGGGYTDTGSNYTPSYRDIISSTTTCYVSIGFRAVLYIN